GSKIMNQKPLKKSFTGNCIQIKVTLFWKPVDERNPVVLFICCGNAWLKIMNQKPYRWSFTGIYIQTKVAPFWNFFDEKNPVVPLICCGNAWFKNKIMNQNVSSV